MVPDEGGSFNDIESRFRLTKYRIGEASPLFPHIIAY